MKALLALHDPKYKAMVIDVCGMFDYETNTTDSLDGMLEIMGVNREDPSSQPQQHYDLYIMDINLGKSGVDDISPAQEVYGHVKQLVDDGKVKFVAMSAIPKIVQHGNEAGIPTIDSVDLLDYLKELSG